MLKEILSISGKPGLYKMVSYGKNLIIVEGLADKKRIPAYSHDKIISLGDIAIYTTSAEVPLSEVLETVLKKNEGKEVEIAALKTPDSLKTFFMDILPDFDEERVYANDIKKIINWYNALMKAGFTTFVKEEETKAEE